MDGVESIISRTGIKQEKSLEIDGMMCHFCYSENHSHSTIIVYQHSSRINEMFDDEKRWVKFQRDLYYAYIEHSIHEGIVVIIYILDHEQQICLFS